jgi:hypothetical protein
MPWTETRGELPVRWRPAILELSFLFRYERIKVAYEGLTQGVGEKVTLDQLTKVRCWVFPGQPAGSTWANGKGMTGCPPAGCSVCTIRGACQLKGR